jgi:hypothetical protein
MPDWKQIVGKNLRIFKTCSPEFAEKLTEELAGHLEDSYRALLHEGLPEKEAFRHTMSQIEGRCRSWLVPLFLKEDLMTGFIRKVAVPGLLAFAASYLVGLTFALVHIQPKTIILADGQFLVLPVWEWCLFPICGALGAILSQRNGGSQLQRIAASIFPSAMAGIVLVLVFAVGFVLSRFVPDYGWDSARAWESLGLWLLGYTAMPAVFLALGAGMTKIRTKRLGRLV